MGRYVEGLDLCTGLADNVLRWSLAECLATMNNAMPSQERNIRNGLAKLADALAKQQSCLAKWQTMAEWRTASMQQRGDALLSVMQPFFKAGQDQSIQVALQQCSTVLVWQLCLALKLKNAEGCYELWVAPEKAQTLDSRLQSFDRMNDLKFKVMVQGVKIEAQELKSPPKGLPPKDLPQAKAGEAKTAEEQPSRPKTSQTKPSQVHPEPKSPPRTKADPATTTQAKPTTQKAPPPQKTNLHPPSRASRQRPRRWDRCVRVQAEMPPRSARRWSLG